MHCMVHLLLLLFGFGQRIRARNNVDDNDAGVATFSGGRRYSCWRQRAQRVKVNSCFSLMIFVVAAAFLVRRECVCMHICGRLCCAFVWRTTKLGERLHSALNVHKVCLPRPKVYCKYLLSIWNLRFRAWFVVHIFAGQHVNLYAVHCGVVLYSPVNVNTSYSILILSKCFQYMFISITYNELNQLIPLKCIFSEKNSITYPIKWNLRSKKCAHIAALHTSNMCFIVQQSTRTNCVHIVKVDFQIISFAVGWSLSL